MLKFLRRRRARAAAAVFDAPVQAEGVIYAVGDIHGRHDLLKRLLDRILVESPEFDVPPLLVFMGDYIDRGEGARETIDLLIALTDRADLQTVFLMGNHEQMLLHFLRERKTGESWLRFGGLQTLMSYGVGSAAGLRSGGMADRVRAELGEALGPHLGFIERLRLSYQTGNLFFAHAGADPHLPLEEQATVTLLWGCSSFLEEDRTDGIWVVHGHTVVEQPVAARGRIAIDTGAYFSGRLTAARIAGGEVSFIQA